MKISKTLNKLMIMLFVLSLSLAACKSKDSENPSPEVTEGLENSELPQQDRAGNDITVAAEIKSIVSLSPAVTQVLEELGQMDKITGVDTNSTVYNTALSELPQFDIMTPNAESLIALHPDIVFVTGMSYVESENPFKTIKDAGICVVELPTSDSLKGIQEDIRFIASCLNMQKDGEAIVNQMLQEIEKISSIGSNIENKKRVLFEVAALPGIYSFGTNVYLDEMLTIIGAENVLSDQTGWTSVTEEAAINANPDVILTNVNYIENPVDEILGRKGWESITAIQNKEVYAIDNEASSIPDHKIVNALKQMAVAVYPEEYASIEPAESK